MLAAAIGFLGYNLGSSQLANAANTASPVNIADPTHPDNLAAVSSAGALSTSQVPGTPKTPLNLSTSGVVGSVSELVVPTTAAIDLTSLTVAVEEFENGGGHVRVFFSIFGAPKGTPPGDCLADATSGGTVQQFEVPSGTTTILAPSSPIVVAPASGQDVCVTYGAEADTGTDTGQVLVSATGFVVSGTYAGPRAAGLRSARLP
jgi:hypothetical protein